MNWTEPKPPTKEWLIKKHNELSALLGLQPCTQTSV